MHGYFYDNHGWQKTKYVSFYALTKIKQSPIFVNTVHYRTYLLCIPAVWTGVLMKKRCATMEREFKRRYGSNLHSDPKKMRLSCAEDTRPDCLSVKNKIKQKHASHSETTLGAPLNRRFVARAREFVAGVH
jgi:hypothetical protein